MNLEQLTNARVAVTVGARSRGDARPALGFLVDLRYRAPYPTCPNVTSPGSLAVFRKNRRGREPVAGLPLEELHALGAENHMPNSQPGWTAFAVGESQCLPIEISNNGSGQLFRARSGQLQTANERSYRGLCGIDDCFALLGGQEHRSLTIILHIIRESLHSPSPRVPRVSKLNCTVQARRYRSNVSIDSSGSASRDKPITPLQVVIPCDLLQLKMGELVFVDDRAESPFRLSGGVRAAVAPKVRNIGLEGRLYARAFDGSNGGTGKLGDPRLRSPLGFVEFQSLTKCFVLMPTIAAAETRNPSVRSASEAQSCPLGEPLPVRLAPQRETFSLTFA